MDDIVAVDIPHGFHQFDIGRAAPETGEVNDNVRQNEQKQYHAGGRYACSIIQLAPVVAGKYLDEVNGAVISEITKTRRKQGVTDATIKRDLVALSSVMNFANDEGYRAPGPAASQSRNAATRSYSRGLRTSPR